MTPIDARCNLGRGATLNYGVSRVLWLPLNMIKRHTVDTLLKSCWILDILFQCNVIKYLYSTPPQVIYSEVLSALA